MPHRMSTTSLRNLPQMRGKSQAEIDALAERLSTRVVSDFGSAKVKSSGILVHTVTGERHAVTELSLFGPTGLLWGRKTGGEIVLFSQATVESIIFPDGVVFQK